MELNDLLSQLKGIGSSKVEKTAEVDTKVQSKEAESQKELLGALSNALNKPSSEKTAQESPSAAAELVKMATDLAGAEQEALVKQAHLYGAAVADGFVSRLTQYQAASTKVASSESDVPTAEEFNKFAEANPELVKEAMELGYRDAQAQIAQIKQAETKSPDAEKIAAFNDGYNATVQEAIKLAEDCSVRGYNDTVKVLQAIAK